MSGILTSLVRLLGTPGKTITCTEDTSLDEAVAMSSKAPKANPSLTGNVTLDTLFSPLTGATSTLGPNAAETIIANSTNYGRSFLVFIHSGVTSNNSAWGGAWFVSMDAAPQAFHLSVIQSADCVLSGTNIQIKNLSGSPMSIYWSAIRIK